MSACSHHPDRQATAECRHRDARICNECIAPGAEDAPLCADWSISVTEEELRRTTAPGSPTVEQPATVPSRPT
jgi:hypothetical protein